MIVRYAPILQRIPLQFPAVTRAGIGKGRMARVGVGVVPYIWGNLEGLQHALFHTPRPGVVTQKSFTHASCSLKKSKTDCQI